MAEATAMPSLAEAMSWVGAEVSDIDGTAVGEVRLLRRPGPATPPG